jgi:hypothetical protein
MLDAEIIAIIEEMEALGVKFTVIAKLDGSLRLNCWRVQNSWQNRDRINQLIAEQIDSSPERAAQIAEFINRHAAATAKN